VAGRKGYNWEGLYVEWLASGLSKAEFLTAKGINPRGGAAATQTRAWSENLSAMKAKVDKAFVKENVKKGIKASVGAVVPDISSPSSVKEAAVQAGVAVSSGSWEIITQWRKKQATEDWKSASVVRSHAQLLLKQSLVKSETGELSTTLSAQELRAIAQAFGEIQKIQRLALGLSTENVGIEASLAAKDTIIEQKVDDGDDVPVFIVEMSQGGKFIRARPRRAQ